MNFRHPPRIAHSLLLCASTLLVYACAAPSASPAAPSLAASRQPSGAGMTAPAGDDKSATADQATGSGAAATKAPKPAPVRFDPPHGSFEAPISVTLHPAEPEATLFYTTDSTLPSSDHGTPYAGPIAITTTTVLRVAVVGPAPKAEADITTSDADTDAKPTDQPPNPIAQTLTQSYVFPRDVVIQPQLPAGWPATWGPVEADYGMNAGPAAAPDRATAAAKALDALPSMSLVLEPPDLVDGERGIYANPLGRGKEWERAGSIEVWGAAEADLQANMGVRIHGGHGREPDKTAKHSFRLLFRKEYGKGSLEYPLFEGEGVDKFDALVLRAPYNDSWAVGSGSQRERALLVRDEWLRRTQLAMGGRAPRGRHVHLYLNGLYWGIYNLAERPDADFTAAYWGGQEDEWDVNNAGDFTDGNDEAWFALVRAFEASPFDEQAYRIVAAQLDLDAFIDYVIAEFYSGNADWPDHNWTAARRRADGELWRFLVWDGERGLEYDDRNNVVDLAGSPGGFFYRLKEIPAFRERFAARWATHFGPGGALYVDPAAPSWDAAHPERNVPAARFVALADGLAPAIPAEAARWGDYRTGDDEPAFGFEQSWIPERARVLAEFFPKRHEVLRAQLKELGVEVGAP